MAKITTIRFEDEFHDEVQLAMIRRRVPSFRVLVNELLQKWLDDPAQDWKTLKAMTQETAASVDFLAEVRNALYDAAKDSLKSHPGFTLVELKSDKLSLSGADVSASGEIDDSLWHELLGRLLASGPRARRAVIQQLFTLGELVDIVAQGRPDAENNPANHRLPETDNPKRTRKIA